MFSAVAIAGATGNLGPTILKALIQVRPALRLVVLRRIGASKLLLGDDVLSQVTIKETDYTSMTSIAANLNGIALCISTLPATAMRTQTLLIDACVLAGVRHIIPSEFGVDMMHPLVRMIPTFGVKTETDEYLEKLRLEGKIDYTLIQTGSFLDWGMAGMLLDPKGKSVELWDGGIAMISMTTLPTIGSAVVEVVKGTTKGKNVLKIRDVDMTQKKLLELAQEVVGADGWEITHLDVEARVDIATTKLYSGQAELDDFMSFIKKALVCTGSGACWEVDDNALLGIEKLTDGNVKDIIRDIVS